VSQAKELPIARLAGVIETPGEHAACSLVFELETGDGRSVRLTYDLLMQALRFAQEEAVMPPLSERDAAAMPVHRRAAPSRPALGGGLGIANNSARVAAHGQTRGHMNLGRWPARPCC
jgi:hypothetical protein